MRGIAKLRLENATVLEFRATILAERAKLLPLCPLEAQKPASTRVFMFQFLFSAPYLPDSHRPHLAISTAFNSHPQPAQALTHSGWPAVTARCRASSRFTSASISSLYCASNMAARSSFTLARRLSSEFSGNSCSGFHRSARPELRRRDEAPCPPVERTVPNIPCSL